MTMNQTNPMLKVVIIDDDLPSIRLLERALEQREDVIVCGCAENLDDGQRLVEEVEPDLLFLDMEFTGSNGLEWYENALLPRRTKVVFHTCYRRYIHDALSLRVFDFLLKPFDPSELEVIIQRFKNLPGAGEHTAPWASMGGSAGGAAIMTPSSGRPLAITSVINSKIIVNPAEIVYFRYMSDRKVWECVFSNLKRIILKRQTTAETILGYGPDFVRTHKHFIVNMRYVGIISGNDCTLLPPLDNITEIKISKSYRRDLLDRFYDI